MLAAGPCAALCTLRCPLQTDRKVDDTRSGLTDRANLRQRDVELTLLQHRGAFTPAQAAAAQLAAAGLAQLGTGAGLAAGAALPPQQQQQQQSQTAGLGPDSDAWRAASRTHVAVDDEAMQVVPSGPSIGARSGAGVGHARSLYLLTVEDSKQSWHQRSQSVPMADPSVAAGSAAAAAAPAVAGRVTAAELKAAIDMLAGSALHQRLSEWVQACFRCLW